MPRITLSPELLAWLQLNNDARLDWFGPIEYPGYTPKELETRARDHRMMEELQTALKEAKPE